MMDRISGRPRGFGFITFADHEVADRVLQEEHVIDGRAVGVSLYLLYSQFLFLHYGRKFELVNFI